MKKLLILPLVMILLVGTLKPPTTNAVIVTAYSSEESQTDSEPLIGAWNNKVNEWMIAVSRDLLKNKIVRNQSIIRLCFYESGPTGKCVMKIVSDVMNKRKRWQADIWHDKTAIAVQFGVQYGFFEVIKY